MTTRAERLRQAIASRHVRLGAIGKDAKVGVIASTASVKAEDKPGNQRVLSMVVTTDDVDLVGDVVDPSGVDTSYVNAPGQNKVFIDHRYETEFVAGSIKSMKRLMEPNRAGIVATLNILSGMTNPIIDDVWTIAKTIGIGASIGFTPLLTTPYVKGDPERWEKAGAIIRRWKMLEISLTAFPCNVSCQTLSCREDEAKRAALDEMVSKSIVSRAAAESLGWGEPKAPRLTIRLG